MITLTVFYGAPDDAETMGAALGSAEGQALTADVANLGVVPTILTGLTE